MSDHPAGPGGDDTSSRIPHKPTREAAIGTGDVEEVTGQRPEPAGMHTPEQLGKRRKEVGDEESSSKHPPHVPEHDADTPIQEELPSPDEVPVLPANATGTDKQTGAEQREEVDPESMYDRRPGRDKDQPPSGRED